MHLHANFLSSGQFAKDSNIDMFLIFSLARPDVFPSGDLAIQKGFALIKNMDTLPTIKYMIDKSKIWKPYRTVASLYLWKINDGEFEW